MLQKTKCRKFHQDMLPDANSYRCSALVRMDTISPDDWVEEAWEKLCKCVWCKTKQTQLWIWVVGLSHWLHCERCTGYVGKWSEDCGRWVAADALGRTSRIPCVVNEAQRFSHSGLFQLFNALETQKRAATESSRRHSGYTSRTKKENSKHREDKSPIFFPIFKFSILSCPSLLTSDLEATPAARNSVHGDHSFGTGWPSSLHCRPEVPEGETSPTCFFSFSIPLLDHEWGWGCSHVQQSR